MSELLDLAHKYRSLFMGVSGEEILADLMSQAEVRHGMLSPEQFAELDRAESEKRMASMVPICPYSMARREGKSALYWHIRNMISRANDDLTLQKGGLIGPSSTV